MKTVSFLIKDGTGRGYLAVNANNSFDLPRNWVPIKKAQVFGSFHEASAQAQILPGHPSVQIVAK
jgi:hypothetical protein